MNAAYPHDTSVLHSFTGEKDPGLNANTRGAEAAEDPAVAGLLILGLAATAIIGAPNQFVQPDHLKSAVAAVLVAVALALWAWRFEKTSVVRWTPLLLAPFGLAVFGLISTAWSPMATAVSEAVRWMFMGTIMFVAMNTMGRESFGAMARAAHWSALIVSLMALAEFWLGFSWFPTETPPGANFGNRNFFAEFAAMVLPFSLWRLCTRSTRNSAALMGLGLGIILVALMSTGTRAGLVSAGLTIVAFLVLAWLSGARSDEARILPSIAVAGIVPAMLVVLALGWLPTTNSTVMTEARGMTPVARASSRILSLASDDTYAPGSSFGVRLAAWQAGARMIGDRPILGVGAGGWNGASALYTEQNSDIETVWLAHNEALQLIAEYGIAGWLALLALVGLLARTIWECAQQFRRRTEVPAALQDSVAVLSIVAFCVVALSGLPLHAATTCYLLALSIGYVLARRRAGVIAIAAKGAVPLRIAQFGAVGLLVLTMAASVQGLRSDFLVQRSGAVLQGLVNDPSVPAASMAEARNKAVGDLRIAYDIYEEHGLQTQLLATFLSKLGDHASAIWLSEAGRKTRPHVPTLKCSIARAQAELGNFDAANQMLDSVAKTHPEAQCLRLAQMNFAFKQGQFAQTVAYGQKFLAQATPSTSQEALRYVVDTSYRAAIRVPNIDAAVSLLNFRAQRWPELRAMSWALAGQLEAARTPGQLSPAAQEAFKKALGVANAQERPQIWARVPEMYRAGLN